MKRLFFMPVALIFVFLALSASTSSCDDSSLGASSYLSSNTAQQSSPAQGGSEYRSMARQDAINAGIDPNLFERQINQESGFNPNALSWAGAKGIAQIMPDTASGWGVDPWNPVASLKAAADHMAWYYQHYGYDYGKALACYNAGCDAVVWAQSHCLNYYWCLPSETRHYIDVIEG